MTRRTLLGLTLILGGTTPAWAGETPPELGDVRWSRDYDAALARARAENKPLLVLFDEVPGCATCVHYGEVVLRHPLIVEAAETVFVPVAIYNNAGGRDRAVLERYGEPTWNNPVVRIVGADEKDLVPRLAGDYSRDGLVRAMIASLEKTKRPVPKYLALLAESLAAERGPTKTAVFSMYCFWSGEACLGAIDGVVASRTGFAHGAEVVEVTYDPKRLSYERLVAAAKAAGCASRVLARTDAEAELAKKHFGDAVKKTDAAISSSNKDDKYQLRHTIWRFVPMTDLQATRANALVGRNESPSALLSPRQRAIHARARTSPPAQELLFVDDLVAAFDAAKLVTR